MRYIIATLASHSCLQILKGAKDEGFRTMAIAIENKVSFYKRFKFIDEVIGIPDYKQFYLLENRLKRKNIIIIPHGSFVAYLGKEGDEKITLPYFGNKKILEIEADRDKQHDWFKKSGLLLPRMYKNIEDVDKAVIVKYHGAQGGYGYFLSPDKNTLKTKLSKNKSLNSKIFLQEYIVGVPIYLQYFFSPLDNKIELMGIDRRYETNIDGLGRIPAYMQSKMNIIPSFTVVGNFPIVVRESLLPSIYEMGEKVVETAKEIAGPKGLYGPFCLETVVTSDQQFYVIEISCRIVAGTNLFISGSQYTDLSYGEPISTGRRIAREIKKAIKLKQLDKILD